MSEQDAVNERNVIVDKELPYSLSEVVAGRKFSSPWLSAKENGSDV